jgi:rod shape-determining protein MreC
MTMRRLYDIVVHFKEYLLFGFFLILCFILLALRDTPQIRSIRVLAVGSVAFVQDAVGFIPNYFDLKRENSILREVNLTLADEVSRLREARLENIRLRQLLGLKGQGPFSYVAARVIGKNIQPLRNTITIDVGESNGVRVNMPIVTDAGLVGKVVATSGGYAVGQLLFNKDFRVSGRVQRGRVDGIVAWEGGDFLVFKNVAKTLDVQSGDVVSSSEYSSIFPSGIKIGVVQKTTQSFGALFQTVEIRPSVDFGRLEEVFVVKYVPDSSRIALEQRIAR